MCKQVRGHYMHARMALLREEPEMEQIKADIALKRVQAGWEPWKAMTASCGAGATVAACLPAFAARVLAHTH